MKTLKTISVMLFWCMVAVGYALVGATYKREGTDTGRYVKAKAKNGRGYAKTGLYRKGGRYA